MLSHLYFMVHMYLVLHKWRCVWQINEIKCGHTLRWYQLSKLNQNLNGWFKSKFRLLIFWKIVFSSPSRFRDIRVHQHRDEWMQIYTCLLHLLLQKSSFGDIVPLSGGSRNFRTGVRGPVAIEFLGSGDCFDAPSYIPYIFL